MPKLSIEDLIKRQIIVQEIKCETFDETENPPEELNDDLMKSVGGGDVPNFKFDYENQNPIKKEILKQEIKTEPMADETENHYSVDFSPESSHHCEKQETPPPPPIMQHLKINDLGSGKMLSDNENTNEVAVTTVTESTNSLKCNFEGCQYEFKTKRKNNWKTHLFFRHFKTRYVCTMYRCIKFGGRGETPITLRVLLWTASLGEKKF